MPENTAYTPAAPSPALCVLYPCPHAGGWIGRDATGARIAPRCESFAALNIWASANNCRLARGWIMPRHNRARHRLTGAEARGILVEMESQGLTPAKRRAAAGAFARMIARGASCATYDAECVYRDYATGAPAHVESAQ